MRRIAVVSHKGGQSKTTSVVNIAACLAGQGRAVLVVDADTQNNATYLLLRGAAPRQPSLSEILSGDATADEAIVASRFEGVDVIPSDPSLADVNVALAGEPGRERRLRSALAEMGRRYDFVIVDTGPTRSLLTTNVLNAVGEVLVPLAPGVFGFLGFVQLEADMAMVRKYLENKALRLTGVFLVQMERTTVCRDFEREIRETLGDRVLATTVPRAVKFEEANARQRSIFEHAPRSAGAVAYEHLTREVLDCGHGKDARNVPPVRPLPVDDAA